MSNALFTGLSAFPLTPANAAGIVDTEALAILVDRLARAGVDSISVLGSTGIYAYLDQAQRGRAVAAAVEAVAGRTPLIVGIGALRTSWSQDLARQAEQAGADGLLLAPMSYTPLTAPEVAEHFRAVAGATGLPLCIYNNPGTTRFSFPDDLIGQLSQAPSIAGIKMPHPADSDFAGELARLRAITPGSFAVGYSGDWGAASFLLAGGAAWYSVIAGLLPAEAMLLTRAAQAKDVERTTRVNSAFEPMWRLIKAHGGLRVMYDVADRLGLKVGEPPRPLQRVSAIEQALDAALDSIKRFGAATAASG